MDEIVLPLAKGMADEGKPYRGILYVGLMLTETGPQVIEFNCRLGDPEAQVILPRLRSDLVAAMQATLDGTLGHLSLRWDDATAVTVVMAAMGYPGAYEKGSVIGGTGDLDGRDDVILFHAGTSIDPDGTVRANGGRVLAVTGLGADRELARSAAYDAISKIDWPGRVLPQRYCGKLTPRGKEIAKLGSGGLFGQAAIDFRVMMTGRAVKEPHPRFHRASLHIQRRKIQAPDAGMGNRPGAHGAGLQRDPQITPLKPILLQALHRRAQRQHFRMMEGIRIAPHPVLGKSDDRAIQARYGSSDRHFSSRRSGRRFIQQHGHDVRSVRCGAHADLVAQPPHVCKVRHLRLHQRHGHNTFIHTLRQRRP